MISIERNENIDVFDLVLKHIEDKLSFYYEYYNSEYYELSDQKDINIELNLTAGKIDLLSIYSLNHMIKKTSRIYLEKQNDEPESSYTRINLLLIYVLKGKHKNIKDFKKLILQSINNSKQYYLLENSQNEYEEYIININKYSDIHNIDNNYWYPSNILEPKDLISFLKKVKEELNTRRENEIEFLYSNFLEIIFQKNIYNNYFKQKKDFKLFFNEIADLLHLFYEKNSNVVMENKTSLLIYIEFLAALNIDENKYFIDAFLRKKKNPDLLLIMIKTFPLDEKYDKFMDFIKKTLKKENFNKYYFSSRNRLVVFDIYNLNYYQKQNYDFNTIVKLEEYDTLLLYDNDFVNKKIDIYNSIINNSCYISKEEIRELKQQIKYFNKQNKDNFIEIK